MLEERREELGGGVLHHQGSKVGAESVPVLLQESGHFVVHISGKVADAKLLAHTALGFYVVRVLAVLLVELLQQGLVRPLREPALLVNKRDYVERFLREQIQNLLVVRKQNVLPVDSLARVLGLLQLEDVLDEELLQILVGVVDADLLETVQTESLEPEYVQHPDGMSGARPPLFIGGAVDSLIDVVYHAYKVAAVHTLSERVSVVAGLSRRERGDDYLSFREGGLLCESLD